MLSIRAWIGIVCVVAATAAAMGQAATAAAPAQEGVSLTVYNGGYGVVREIRKLTVPGLGEIKFTDVASAIDATTVHFQSLADPTAKLLEQNYQYDLVSADKLLYKYIDRNVEVVVPGKTYSGTLLSFDGNQIVLKEEGGITMVQRADNVRDIRFKELPEGLLTRPTLVWLVASDKPGPQLCEVTYQTGGVQWHAEYVLVLAEDDKSADLSGWVSVQNNSGKRYVDAHMKFIAGDVRKIVDQLNTRGPVIKKDPGDRSGAQPMQEKAFFEYHMYTLPRASTVGSNEVKQLEMFTPVQGLGVVKRFLYSPLGPGWRWYGGLYTDKSYGVTSEKKVAVFIEFKNAKENRLGIPLPAGKVRVYKQDTADNALEFIGEEKIDHTPKDEELSLQIGNAFDLVGERRQTNFAVDVNRHWMQESFEIKLRNHKEAEGVVIRVKEPLCRWSNWKITEKNQEFLKLDARTIAFDVPVKAGGEATVTYTVDYTW